MWAGRRNVKFRNDHDRWLADHVKLSVHFTQSNDVRLLWMLKAMSILFDRLLARGLKMGDGRKWRSSSNIISVRRMSNVVRHNVWSLVQHHTSEPHVKQTFVKLKMQILFDLAVSWKRLRRTQLSRWIIFLNSPLLTPLAEYSWRNINLWFHVKLTSVSCNIRFYIGLV